MFVVDKINAFPLIHCRCKLPSRALFLLPLQHAVVFWENLTPIIDCKPLTTKVSHGTYLNASSRCFPVTLNAGLADTSLGSVCIGMMTVAETAADILAPSF